MPKTAEPPIFFNGSEAEHIRKVALISREILNGKTNNTDAYFTLRPNETETYIDSPRVCCDTVPQFTPKSASAAAALASGSMYYEAHNGRITVHHDLRPDEDRVFGLVLVG